MQTAAFDLSAGERKGAACLLSYLSEVTDF